MREIVALRTDLVGQIERHLRRGVAVKLVGGRGMGKSVLLHQVQARFRAAPARTAVTQAFAIGLARGWNPQPVGWSQYWHLFDVFRNSDCPRSNTGQPRFLQMYRIE